ncbi:MAG: Nramp family divalent metal transporter [Flavobacteriaceae bacterium]|tara:strand:- start:2462 stop:3673 length:1212 start_codon:yes stop_codon:yes gene_type:complete
MINFLKKLGPGLLFAGAAIGVSHLVQSTKAGAEFGFGLIWALILCNFFKYPFFLFGTKYAHATGETLLDGYKKIGDYVLIIYLILSFVTIFTIQAAVTIVTAGLAIELFGFSTDITIWAIIIILGCLLLLLIGKYSLLDNLIKIIILVLGICTVLAVFYAKINSDMIIDINQIIPSNFEGIIFLVAFMGWMPAPLDVSIWQSIWTKEKIAINKTIDYKTALYDFNIGYITTVVLGICFISLGAFVMYNSGEKFSDQGGEFAGQLIDLYTSSIGENMFLIIAIAAFTTMFSTTITCLDASPRAMDKSFELLGFRKLSGYNFWLVILSAGTILIFIFFMSEMGSLVKIATILSFITAPIYAILNYTLITSKFMPSNFHLSIKMKVYSIIGIIFLSSFSIWYITLI